MHFELGFSPGLWLTGMKEINSEQSLSCLYAKRGLDIRKGALKLFEDNSKGKTP